MAGLTRKVHMISNIEWADNVDRFAPDLGIRTQPDGNGGQPETPAALRFTDPDGEVHVYIFNEDGRKALIRQLTGGLIIPKGG